jgi:hypothetical protein
MFHKGIAALAGLAGLVLAACATASAPFQSQPVGAARPWTAKAFDDAPDTFAFAVVADLESGYRPGVFDVATNQLALMHPAFVMTIGDMIDGGTEDIDLLRKEWTEFDALLAPLKAPFFHVAGNHDMTNLTQRRAWEERFGPRYYWFIYRDVLFCVLDTEDYSDAEFQEIYRQRDDMLKLRRTDPAAAAKLPYASRIEAQLGEIGPQQSAYFEKVLAEHPDVRWTFVLFHKPVYLRTDGQGLERIEKALGQRKYTVLNGHRHNYSYAERNNRDYIMLGTTGGERGFAGEKGALDHFMWVTMTKDGPSIANLRLDGVLDKKADIPANGARLCLSFGGPNCPPIPAK